MRRWVAAWGVGGAVVLATAVSACGEKTRDAGSPAEQLARGQALYADLCASCHGARGEGGVGPRLRDYANATRGEPELTRTIDERMPPGAPEKCDGDCPPSIAKYILTNFVGEVTCTAPVPVARGLRLLNRRELEATLADLFGAPAATTGPSTPPGTCGAVTFTYDPKGRATNRVHVAGSFNGWPGTVAAGGWELQKSGATFSTTRTLPNGSHAYKLVLDESSWIADPNVTRRGPDGFGGENSLIDVNCTSNPSSPPSTTQAPSFADLFAAWPKESRPDGFSFDTHGPSRVSSSPLAEATFRMSKDASSRVDIPKLMACTKGVDDTCAKDFVARFGKRAFRRPLSADESRRYESMVLAGTDRVKGARLVVRAMLGSPAFLYRTETGSPRPDGTFVLTPWETASAISYALVGSMPDDELFSAAEKGELSTVAGREKQARRLLASPRLRDTLGTFALEWLGAESIGDVEKNAALYPDDSPALRASMREEAKRFFNHVVFDGSHRASELFTANYTFVDGRLAKLYGMQAPADPSAFERRDYPDRARAGVMGQASVLATTAHSDQTSPIRRGLFVRRNLLCQDLPPPPPNAGTVPKIDPSATTRERFAQHTANPFCATCHRHIDPVGFGFERFDPIGRLRDTEGGKPIDAKGDMSDVEGLGTGTHASFTDLASLGVTLGASHAAEACVAKQLYRFTRGVKETDGCATKPYEKRFAEHGGDVRELLVDLVSSEEFTVRK
jgi:hypothetical protein